MSDSTKKISVRFPLQKPKPLSATARELKISRGSQISQSSDVASCMEQGTSAGSPGEDAPEGAYKESA